MCGPRFESVIWKTLRSCKVTVHCTIKLLKYFSKFFKFNIYQPTSSKGKLKNTFVAVSVHKYEGGADKCRLLSLLFVSSTGRRGAGGSTWHCPCHADRPWLVIYTRKKIREGGGGGEGGMWVRVEWSLKEKTCAKNFVGTFKISTFNIAFWLGAGPQKIWTVTLKSVYKIFFKNGL